MSTSKKEPRTPAKEDGKLRQSQLVTTFGPGAMVDLVDHAVVIGGLEHWSYGPKNKFVALGDPRLRRSLVQRLKALDPDLDLARDGYFRMAPEGDGRNPYPNVGVRALQFPRWFVCQGCRRLARAQDQFEEKNKRYRHACAKNKWSSAVPVRFVSACRRGHLSDFPWATFAHLEREGGICERQELYLEEKAIGDIGKIIVRCKNCEHWSPMSKATVLSLPCNGDRPWLGGKAANEKCELRMELLVRTASHAYFAQVVSALRLPDPKPDPLRQRLQDKDVWKAVQKITSPGQLAMVCDLMEHVANAVKGASPADVLAAIAVENAAAAGTTERPLRSAEYERLTKAPVDELAISTDPNTEFAAFRIPKDRIDLPPGIGGLVVVPELREVRVQVSFSRFDSIEANLQGEYDFKDRRVKPSVLTLPTGSEKWLPAAEVRGEGIFVELDPIRLLEWETSQPVQQRAEQLLRAFERDGQGFFPGIRFFMLHSLAHLLLTAISLECGYAASSIRERIYCGRAEEGGPDMAAVMLTTGTTGSEGTLGGLVEEGRRIRHHLREAWDLGRLCSNDPVCAAHNPNSDASDRRTEGAACHGCLYIAECSCERFNRFLDRALVVPTIGNDPALAFFPVRP